MSYTTTLYAVDIDALKAAVGSHDDALLRRLRDACDPPAANPDGPAAPHFSAPQSALSDLVSGSLSGPEHGRALEVLCHVLGTRLPDDDLIGDLEPLELDTPLPRPRPPVAIEDYADFPIISYLSADEVAAEVRRLSAMDLSFPDDEDIEEARQALFACLKMAADRNLGVVTFYQ